MAITTCQTRPETPLQTINLQHHLTKTSGVIPNQTADQQGK
jgi:hypothetical protein